MWSQTSKAAATWPSGNVTISCRVLLCQYCNTPLAWQVHHKTNGSISVQHAIGYRKRETPQGGRAKGGEPASATDNLRGVGCLSVGAGRQRRRLGLRRLVWSI